MIDKNIVKRLDSIIESLINLEMDIAKDFRDKMEGNYGEIVEPQKLLHGELFNFTSIAIRHLSSAKYRIEQEKKLN